MCAFDLDRMIELCSKSKFDVSKIQKNTLVSMCSHLNLLKPNNIDVSSKLLETADLNQILLVNRRNEKLTPQYKIQVAVTLKRMYGSKNMQLDLDMAPYLAQVKRTPARVEDYDYMTSLSRLVNHSAEILVKFQEDRLDWCADLAVYDAAMATVLHQLHQSSDSRTTSVDNVRFGLD